MELRTNPQARQINHETEPWHKRSLCADVRTLWDVGISEGAFFANSNTIVSKLAREVCARCPVQDRCLQEAVEDKIPHGIWGGATEEDRREFARNSTTYRKTLTAIKARIREDGKSREN